MKTKEEFYLELQEELDELRAEGLFKTERVISSSQGSKIELNDGTVRNLTKEEKDYLFDASKHI